MVKYRETIWSELFAGNRHTVTCFPAALSGVQSSLDLAPEQRQRTVWRFDSGGGSDATFRSLLAQGYQVHAKGISHTRAKALAGQVKRWDEYQDMWLGEVQPTFDLGRPFRLFVQKRVKGDNFMYSYYISTLHLSSKKQFVTSYNARGGAEVAQFREDKSGLSMGIRRKRSLTGQKGYILLTDLAHNLLAHFHRHALVGSCFESYGLKRIVRDLLGTPGRLTFADNKLVKVELLSLKQNAAELLTCLEKYSLGGF